MYGIVNLGERVPWLDLKIQPLGRLGESECVEFNYLGLDFEH